MILIFPCLTSLSMTIWETGVDIYTLLYMKEIADKTLMYNTGNSTQYSVMAYMGIESERVDRRLCITDSFCCIAETNTTL